MVNLFGEDVQIPKKHLDNKKIKWKNAFQKWSDNYSQDDTTPLGKCGYGAICDYCTDNHYGKPCVRALGRMIRDKYINIDYTNLKDEYFEFIFCGETINLKE